MTNPANDTLPEDQAAAEPTAETAAETGTHDVAALEAQVAEYKDQALRAMAEAENTRRRAAKEREDATKYGVTSLAKELLGVSDNLRRALDAAAQNKGDTQSLITGVEATERQLLGAFERVGIKKIEPLDEKFDPNFHRVMLEMENTGKEAGTVVQVLQPGYVIHDRLLREALVAIAKGDSPAQTGAVNTSA